MIISLYIGNDKLDLFNDETIELKSSVQDANDITKNTTDFTKNFSVPASEINNRIFKHYYDATLDNGFDARTKVNGRIEIDGVVFRYGKFSLLACKLKQGLPSSYNIVFYGNLVSLVDLLKDDELTSLDLSAYDHEYNSDNVLEGVTDSLFGGLLVYPLFAKKQYYYNSTAGDNTDTDLLSNIAFNGGADNGIRWSDLRPSISLLPIIEAIETKYNITFTRDFFAREEFTKLYLWLNENSQNTINGNEQIIDWNGGSSTYVNFTTNILTLNNTELGSTYIIEVFPDTGFDSIEYTLEVYNNGELFYSNTYTGDSSTTKVLTSGTNNEIYYVIKTNDFFSYTATLRAKIRFADPYEITTASINSIVDEFVVSNNLPKMKIIDFLKGVFNMFKLVVIQENNTDPIYINTLKDYYSAGKVYDITRFINFSEFDVERGELLNEILYKFQDPTTILNSQFKVNTGQGYGDEVLRLEDEEGKPLDGGKQDYSVPFEQIVYERLPDVADSTDTNIMYGAIIDDKAEPTNPKPHIHYVVNNSVGTKTFSFIDDTNTEIEVSTFINVPSHTLGFDNPQFSTVFGKEINEFSKEIISNTLYSNYHSDYITSIFNFKRRNFKYEANLPTYIMLKLKLNDVLKIKENYYRLNDFTYNLMTGKTKLNLINSFDNTINGFVSNRTTILTDYTAKTESVYVTNFTNFSFILNDLGFSTSWVTDVYNVGNNIYFDIDENASGIERQLEVVLTNTDTLQTITITIIQGTTIVLFGSEEILFGNTLITFE